MNYKGSLFSILQGNDIAMDQIFVVKSEKLSRSEPQSGSKVGQNAAEFLKNNFNRVCPQLRWAKDSESKDSL